jgi:hypothetical protein
MRAPLSGSGEVLVDDINQVRGMSAGEFYFELKQDRLQYMPAILLHKDA